VQVRNNQMSNMTDNVNPHRLDAAERLSPSAGYSAMTACVHSVDSALCTDASKADAGLQDVLGGVSEPLGTIATALLCEASPSSSQEIASHEISKCTGELHGEKNEQHTQNTLSDIGVHSSLAQASRQNEDRRIIRRRP